MIKWSNDPWKFTAIIKGNKELIIFFYYNYLSYVGLSKFKFEWEDWKDGKYTIKIKEIAKNMKIIKYFSDENTDVIKMSDYAFFENYIQVFEKYFLSIIYIIKNIFRNSFVYELNEKSGKLKVKFYY